jgi:23S rRNA (pseudouridine1915-N3)-methyltransferase
MKLVLLYVSGLREEYGDTAEAVFAAKIKPMVPFEIQTLKARSSPRAQSGEKKRIESEMLLGALKPDDYVIALDEKGKLARDSREFSKWLVRAIESGKKRVVVIIGGPFGLDEPLRKRADLLLSLSPLTFNHHVAKVTALEQLYRGLAIWRNLPYHND